MYAHAKSLKPVRTVAPAELPVTLADVKSHIEVSHAEHDARITNHMNVAVAHLDGFSGVLGRALVTQTWRQDWNRFPSGKTLPLPLSPAQNGSETVTYYDANNQQQTLASSVYHFIEDDMQPALTLDYLAEWPDTYDRPDAVRVTADYGYGAASAVPPDIVHAIYIMCADLYEFRETATQAVTQRVASSMTVQALVSKYCRVQSA